VYKREFVGVCVKNINVSKIVPFIKSNTRHKTEKTVDETAEGTRYRILDFLK